MSARLLDSLSRREAEIMEVLFRLGEASVAHVQEKLPNPPSYSTVRALLAILERKGHLKHREARGKYLYTPARPRASAARRALKRVVETFFQGSVEHAVAALLQSEDQQLSREDLNKLQTMIAKAKKEKK